MNINTSLDGVVLAEIEALKERFREEMNLLLEKLTPNGVECMRSVGVLDLDADDRAMREHLAFMS